MKSVQVDIQLFAIMENQTKAIPLVTNRRVLKWLCVYPAEASTSKSQQFVYILFTFVVFGGISASLLASVAYFLKYFETDLEAALFAVSQISAAAGIFYTIIMTIFSRRGFFDIFQTLHQIYETCKFQRTKIQFFKIDTKNIENNENLFLV